MTPGLALGRWVTTAMFVTVLSFEPPETDVESSKPPIEESDLTRARDLFDHGRTQYETANYEDAIELWTEAYGAVPNSPQSASIKAALIYNIATAQAKAYHVDRDLTHLRQAEILMQSYADSIPALYGETVEAKTEHERIEERIAQVRRDIAQAEAEALARVEEATPVSEGAVTPESENIPPPKQAPSPKPLIVAGGTLIGVGAAGLGIMIAGLVIGGQANDDVPSEYDERDEQFDRGRTGNTLAYVGAIAGGALIIGGGALLGLGLRRRGARAAASPYFGPNHAGVVASGRF